MTDVFLITLAFAVIFNFLFFIPAFLFNTDKLTDISYALTFLILALITVSIPITVPKIILLCMIGLWALRLGGFLFIRMLHMKRDHRFDKIRGKFVKFGGFFLLQAFSAWVILIPSIVYLSNGDASLTALSWAGMAVWLIGISIEKIADWQKYKYKCRNKKTLCVRGLWKYSRHPNYFGEILVWLGIFIFTMPLVWQYALINFISPLYITVLLLLVTGIPKLERHMQRKYGKAFTKYKQSTSMLIPWFRK
ncbi:DUF1295 domain-containing protein [Nanoarchaeota archaeon]